MPFDIKTDIMELLKFGVGDAVVQYPYYKFVGDKLVGYLKSLGKYADVGGAFVYSLAVRLLSDNVGGEFADYLNQGAASVLGRALSVAMGDPAISAASPPSVQLTSGGAPNFSTLNPVPLVRR